MHVKTIENEAKPKTGISFMSKWAGVALVGRTNHGQTINKAALLL